MQYTERTGKTLGGLPWVYRHWPAEVPKPDTIDALRQLAQGVLAGKRLGTRTDLAPGAPTASARLDRIEQLLQAILDHLTRPGVGP